ncbi:MAG TPA: cytochrome c oxidase subunit 3 [Steroidobacteraceae bacterium]|jgi:cytochrome c oxidase subunit 3|nr:cytochrome c oxidase subunit 3 [Steroidobacteraceae bacterium]
MNIWGAFGVLSIGVIVWFLLIRKLNTRSWERHGSSVHVRSARGDVGEVEVPPARIALWVFLAVITSLFGLFISAYFIRMGHGHGAAQAISDWRSVSKPSILWVNTAMLILSSVTMQAARHAVKLNNRARVLGFLSAGGVFAVLFLGGQLIAWYQLRGAGYGLTSGPAGAFFYVLTGVHGLHLLGGLTVWLKTMIRMRRRAAELIDVRLSIELCTVYWHYLLLVWLVMFALLLST